MEQGKSIHYKMTRTVGCLNAIANGIFFFQRITVKLLLTTTTKTGEKNN